MKQTQFRAALLTHSHRDQELRFTVRDGADYNRLKVSVFNDDRRTDLIGETWVMLDSLLLPGGGQGDSWHNLSCRGKYAGEIRIELTYYDSRPKEIRAPREPRQRQSLDQATPSPQTAGPRDQPQVRRRPLPTPDGQEHSHSAPQLATTSSNVPMPTHAARSYHTPPRRLSEQPVYEEPEEQEYHVELEPDAYTQHPTALASYASTSTNPYHSSPTNTINSHELPAIEDQGHFPQDVYHYPVEHQSSQYTENTYQHSPYVPLRNERVHALSSIPPRPLPPIGLHHSNSAPDAIHYDATDNDYLDHALQYAPQPEEYQNQYSTADFGQSHVDYTPHQPGAPIPQHRLSAPVLQQIPRTMHQFQPSQPSHSSPLQAHAAPYDAQMPFDPATAAHPLQHRHSYMAPASQPMHYSSPSTYAQPAQQESPLIHRPQPRYPEPRTPQPHSPYAPASHGHQHTHSVPDFSRSLNMQPASTAPLRTANGWQPPRGRPLSMVEASAAAAAAPRGPGEYQQPQGSSSGPQAVARKSVSPQAPVPTSASAHFSPDSFNAYNTHASRPVANSGPDRSPKDHREPSPMYSASMPTPESTPDSPATIGTRTTADGRILTQSGKAIDPSDHIPYTSWAPEPEPKNGSRPTVAVHIKNRFGPRDARSLQNSPLSGSSGATSPASVSASPLAGASMRPRHSINPSPVTPLPLPHSNSHPGRNRLQKRTPSNPLAESAPGTLNASYRAPSTAGAPPIPPKLPLGYANGEFSPANEPINDALSQEMSLIDIGSKEEAGRRRGLFGRRKKVDEYS